MDSLEDQIFADFQPESLEEIFRVKKELLLLRRSVTPLRDVFNTLLRREQPIFSRETHTYFQDVFDHLIRVADTIDTLRDMRRARSPSAWRSSTSKVASPARIARLFSLNVDVWMIARLREP